MWKCIECRQKVPTDLVDPEVDSDGCFFVCPECGCQNPLVNVASSMGCKFGSIYLKQVDTSGFEGGYIAKQPSSIKFDRK